MKKIKNFLKLTYSKIKSFCASVRKNVEGKIDKNNVGSKLTIIAFLIAPLIVMLALEIMHLADFEALLVFFLPGQHWWLKILLSYVFVLACQCVLIVIFGRIKWAYLVNAIFFYLLSLITYVTLNLTGDPLLPSDLLLAKNLKQIASFVEIPFRINYLISLLVIVLGFLLMSKIQKSNTKKIKLHIKIVLGVVFIVFFAVVFYMYCLNYNFRHRTMDKMNIEIAAFNPVDNLRKNGLVLTFFPRIGDLMVETPENYSEETVNEIKEKYLIEEYVGNDSNVKPTVILIQNEAWWDPTELKNASFSGDVMPTVNNLKNQGYPVGKFVTPVFSGGTCMPEFEALTAYATAFLPANTYPYIQHILSETPSIVKEYQNNGYETVAIHPYHKNFYNRSKAYPLLGFDKFLGIDDFGEMDKKGWYASDEYAVQKIIEAYENKTKEQMFCFMVTMQNHGAYNPKRYDYYDIEVKCNNMTEEELQGLNDFTQGAYDSDKALGTLIEYFKNVKSPVIIAMYGDHQPLLGTEGSTYVKGGMIEEKETFVSTEHPNLYETPYVVWSNYGAEIPLPEHISAGKLGLEILKASKLEKTSGYFSLIDRFYTLYPAFTKHIVYDHTGAFMNNIKEIDKELKEDYKMLQYDLLHGEKYFLNSDKNSLDK